MAGRRSDSRIPRALWSALLIGGLFSGAATVFGQAPGPAGSPPSSPETVVQVRIAGNHRVARERVLSEIQTRAGRPFDQELIEEDVLRLNRTGLFVEVKPMYDSVPGGRVVIFQVVERPILQYVRYVGNRKVSKKTLEKEAELKSGDALDLWAIREARRRLEEYYHGHGFPEARVIIVEGNRTNDVGATFLITEGQKQKVLWTQFEGNTITGDGRLKTQIQSKPGFLWVFQGDVSQEKIDEDVDRVEAYYKGLGFFDVRVGRVPEFKQDLFDPNKEWLILTFVIDEGPRYTIRNVSFMGNETLSNEELASGLQVEPGEHFNQAEMRSDVVAIQDKYGAQGYVFADIQANPRFLDERGKLDLVYNISEGKRCVVGRINVHIKGPFPHTRVSTVLNRLSIKPGDILDIRELRKSERRLKASNLFEMDPRVGKPPEIAFNAPSLEDMETQMAGPPGASPRVRRQSPDGEYRWSYGPADTVPKAPGDKVIEVDVEGTWTGYLPPEEEPFQVRPDEGPRDTSGARPPSSTESASLRLARALGQRQARPAPPFTGATAASRRAPAAYDPFREQPVAEPGRIEYVSVRAQSYSPDDGRSVPSLDGYTGTRGGYNVPAAEAYPSTATSSTSQPTFFPEVHTQPQAIAPPSYGLPPVRSSGPVRTAANEPFADVPPLWGNSPMEEPPLVIDLDATGQETRTGRFMFSVGINSDAGLLGSIIVDEQNFDIFRFPTSWADIRDGIAFRGRGQRFRLEAVPGSELQRYTINFQDPYLFSSRVSLGTSGFYYTRRYREWDEEQLGGRVALGYEFAPDLSGSLAFRGAKITLFNPVLPGIPDLDEALGDNALYGFQARLAHDTRDSAFLPTQGHLVEVSFEQVIGTFDYPRSEFTLRQYFMLLQRPDGSGRHVLGLNTRLGITGENTPIYEHYFAGGYSTIRGFDFRGASPKEMGVSVGGHFLLTASLEYMFPITADDMLRGVVFCDTGTVEPTIKDWTDNYRVAPGFGLRITVPAMGPAPIALDFAFPVSHEPGDEFEMFSFFVGFLR